MKLVAYAPDVSTRWQKFPKAVIELVNETHPGKQYETLAYQAYRDVPTEVAPFFMIGYTTYNINYTKPITDPLKRRKFEKRSKLGRISGTDGHWGISLLISMNPCSHRSHR